MYCDSWHRFQSKYTVYNKYAIYCSARHKSCSIRSNLSLMASGRLFILCTKRAYRHLLAGVTNSKVADQPAKPFSNAQCPAKAAKARACLRRNCQPSLSRSRYREYCFTDVMYSSELRREEWPNGIRRSPSSTFSDAGFNNKLLVSHVRE